MKWIGVLLLGLSATAWARRPSPADYPDTVYIFGKRPISIDTGNASTACSTSAVGDNLNTRCTTRENYRTYVAMVAQSLNGKDCFQLVRLSWDGSPKAVSPSTMGGLPGLAANIASGRADLRPGNYPFRVEGNVMEVLEGKKRVHLSIIGHDRSFCPGLENPNSVQRPLAASASVIVNPSPEQVDAALQRPVPTATRATAAQSNRTVLLMGADNDTIVTSFATENACADLHETRIFEKGGVLFDWALAVVGHEGRFEVALLDEVNKRATFLGTNYREGTRNACYIIRGLTSAKWEPIIAP